MNPIYELMQVLGKWVAKALGGPKRLSHNIMAATLSVVEYCAELFRLGVVEDVRRIKESLIQRSEAETKNKQAEAAKKMAEAAEAENKANLSKRNDRVAMLEKERLELENGKTKAEIEAIQTKTETEGQKAIIEAKARFLEAIASLRKEEGDIYFNKESLDEFLNINLPRQDDE
jgi:hypothetical protein